MICTVPANVSQVGTHFTKRLSAVIFLPLTGRKEDKYDRKTSHRLHYRRMERQPYR